MDEKKRLTGEEQRQLMKEQYKQDLRMRKEFLDKVNELKRQEPLLKAIEGLNVEDDTDEWISKLNQKSAMTEAKMEMALDSSGLNSVSPDTLTPAISDEEIRKIQAAELVSRMKAEMQGNTGTSTPSSKPTSVDAAPSTEEDRPARKMLDGLV